MRRNSCAALAAVAIAAVLSAGTGDARAAFVNGLEEFIGTAVDDNTWVRYTFGQGNMTVSNGYLDITGQNYLATKSLTVGVGDTISARVMLTSASQFGTVIYLGLTQRPDAPFIGEHVFLSLSNTIQGESDFTFFSMKSNGSASGTPLVMSDDNIGKWYRLQLHRTSLNDYTAELFTDAGSTVFSVPYTDTGLAERANVFIGLGPTARFDWVAVPEPGAASALVWAVCLLLRLRRTGSRGP